jgi:prepilin-type N-terminal cleavage/methylation domain-containing protein
MAMNSMAPQMIKALLKAAVRRAFTLIELLVVIAISSILAARFPAIPR